MKIKYVIGVVVGVMVVALLLPIGLVLLSDISVVVDGQQIRLPKSDTTFLNLLVILLPVLICIGLAIQFTSLNREPSICKSCIWFLKDLTCEKGYELDCKECEGLEV